MDKEIICKNCGGAFGDHLPECPYCGTLHYPSAETEYLKHLEDVRENMVELQKMPEAETRKEIRKKGYGVIRFLGILVIPVLIIVLLFWLFNREDKRDAQADYLWKKETFPKLDEWYEDGNYQELCEAVEQAYIDEKPIYLWEHRDFCEMWESAEEVLEYLSAGDEGRKLHESDELWLLRSYWTFRGITYRTTFTEDELERLNPYLQEVQEKLADHFVFTQEELEQFEQEIRSNYGYPEQETCEAYIEQWMKGNKKREM